MDGLKVDSNFKAGARLALSLVVLALLTACASKERLGGAPETASPPPPAEAAEPPPPPPPPPPAPPPVALAGKWRLSAPHGGCLMTFGATPGAADGTIAPAGGCPGKFFTSRKWTYEHDRLIVRDYKGQVLVELSFAGGRFEGKDMAGTAISLAR